MRPTLYHLPECPYCQFVRGVAGELGIEIDLVDVRAHPEARAHLIAELGRGTVPVLGIPTADGESLLPESRDIAEHLRAEQARYRRAS